MDRILDLFLLRHKISWVLILFYGILLFLPETLKIHAPGPMGYVASYIFNAWIGCALALIIVFVGELLSLIHRNILYVWHSLFAAILTLFAISEFFLISVFGLQWNAFTFQLLNETNNGEITGFFETYSKVWQFKVSVVALVVIISIVFFIFRYFKLETIERNHKNTLFRGSVTIVLLSIIFYEIPCLSLNAYNNYGRSDKLIRRDGLWNLYQSVLMYYEDKDLLDICIASQKNTEIVGCSAKSKNIVLIIGETYNRHHSSLYGYDLETMPECKNLGAIVFSDVISPANATTSVFRYLLSFAEVNGNERWCDTPLFPYIFKQAGYNVTFYSNQYVVEGELGFYDASAGFFNHPAIYGKLFNSRNHSKFGYDMGLVDDFKQNRTSIESDSLNLIIFHLIGQHSPAVERYPHEYSAFSVDDYNRQNLSEEQLQYIADYDNATRYNDAVVSEIVRMYEDQDAIILYVADHGEEIYDFRDKAGRFYDFDQTGADGLHNQLDVPFIVFASDCYRESHPEEMNAIYSATDKPFMTDLFPHILLGLAGIDCKWYDEKKDLFSINYDTSRHRVVSGTDIDYDEVCIN